MSANLSDLFTGDSHFSPPRVNAGKWYAATGDEIAAIPNDFQLPAVICTETGSGFIATVAYYSQYDPATMLRTGWLPFSPKHMHDVDDDIAGGLYSDIRNANMGKFAYIFMPQPKAADFTVNKTGTNATVTNEQGTDTERAHLTTGTPAANDLVSITKAGLRGQWGKVVHFQVITFIGVGTSMFARTGTGIERVDQDTDDRRKIGLEDCSITSANRQIVTADGNTSSRTLLTTTQPTQDTSTPLSHKLIFNPGVDVKYYVDNVLKTTKQNNIPAGTNWDRDRTFRAGIKTTNTTEKTYDIYAVGIYYVPGDHWY